VRAVEVSSPFSSTGAMVGGVAISTSAIVVRKVPHAVVKENVLLRLVVVSTLASFAGKVVSR
jgi:hypothetical protein